METVMKFGELQRKESSMLKSHAYIIGFFALGAGMPDIMLVFFILLISMMQLCEDKS